MAKERRLSLFFAIAVIHFLCPVLLSGQDPAPFLEATVNFTDRLGHSSESRYRLLPPDEIEEGKRYPLLLFLHGAGERGDDNVAQLRHLPERLATKEGKTRFNGFVLAPQCRRGARWAEVPWDAALSSAMAGEPGDDLKGAIAALQSVVRTHPIDTDRITLTGLSMGGFGSFELATRYPEWFAGVVPICGGGDERSIHRLCGLPLWAIHGAEDRVVPPTRSRSMIDALRALGERPGYSEYPDVGHNSWGRAYTEGGPLDWLVKKRNPLLALPRRSFGRLIFVLSEKKSTTRVVFLGDSITEAGDRPEGYVGQIREAVKGLSNVEIVGAGISGHRVPDLRKRLERDVIRKRPDVVFVYIGINDVWHHDHGSGTSPEDYRRGLTEIVTRIQDAGAKVILATPSVIGEKTTSKQHHDERLEQYSAISREIAKERNAELCDLRRLFHDVLMIRNVAQAERGILTSDGVHLSKEGDALVAYAAAGALAQVLLPSAEVASPRTASF